MNGIKKWFGILVLLPGVLTAQLTITEGQVVDSIPVSESNFLSYYVPSGYDSKKAWPVIYVFDPGGDAHLAVSTFRSAAENHGYVIISGTAIKNGSYQENYRHARDVFTTSKEMFKLDSLNQFTAGFSGGARLAIAIAGLSKDIKGAIASGAGLNTVSSSWLRNNPFIFIGTCGDEDFNYTEMKLTEKVLLELKYPHEMIWFEGGHQWPPEEVLEKAVRDLSVLMFSRQQQRFSEDELLGFYNAQLDYNKQLQASGNWVWAHEDLEKMRDWYSIFGRDSELKDRLKEVRRNKQYRSQRSDMKYVDEIEPLYLEEYLEFLVNDIRAGDLEALGYWDQEMEQFNKAFTESKKEAQQKMAIRIKSMLELITVKGKEALKEPEGYDQLLFINIFLTLLDENDADAYLESMRLAVATGDYDIALYYTDKLLSTGYKDIDRIREYPGITLLRIQPEFGEVLEKYGFESRF